MICQAWMVTMFDFYLTSNNAFLEFVHTSDLESLNSLSKTYVYRLKLFLDRNTILLESY